MRRIITLLAVLGMSACGGAEQQAAVTVPPASTESQEATVASQEKLKVEVTAYVHGKVEGEMAKQLHKVLGAKKWRGETDGMVLMSGAGIPKLSDAQKVALKEVLKQGHAILLTGVTQEQLVRLHAFAAAHGVPSISLAGSAGAQPAELYVIGAPRGLLRTLAIRTVPGGIDRSEIQARYAIHAEKVREWFVEHVRASDEAGGLALAAAGDYDVLGTKKEEFPWMHSEQYLMPAYYSGTCTGTQSCVNIARTNIYAWAVHNPLPLTNQPGDYVIARVTSSIDVAACKLPLGDHNRFAGYWLQQANLGAAVQDVTLNGYRLVDGVALGEYAPIATNPDVEETNGVTWNFGGSGTISGSGGFSGAKPTAELSKSLGFSFGVSYTNQSTFKYAAVETMPKIPADVSNPSKVLWSYDSSHFTHSNLEPGNHACGGPGLNKSALPPIIYGSSFNSSQDFVWALLPEIRKAVPMDANGYSYLPVQVDTSMLLGWAFYWESTGYCKQSNATGYHFALGDKSIDIVGLTDSPPLSTAPNNTALFAGNGLAFDSGCGTTTNFGTIPLGDRQDGDRRNNVGPPYPFDSMVLNLPLAPDPRRMTLTSISPQRGPAGQVVVLRGTALNTATSVNFGGLAPYSMSLEIPEDGVPVITVTAPNRIAPEGNEVMISVENSVTTSQGFRFTYTD